MGTAADPEALRRLRAALPGAVPAAAARLLLYGHAFGCLPEAVALAALASQPDLFLLPRRSAFVSQEQFTAAFDEVLEHRRAADGGRFSEPLACLSAYRLWHGRKEGAISPRRAEAADLIVLRLCRALLGLGSEGRPLPLAPGEAQQLHALCRLVRIATPADKDDSAVFAAPAPVLYLTLAAAGAPAFLTAAAPQPGVLQWRTAAVSPGLPNGTPVELNRYSVVGLMADVTHVTRDAAATATATATASSALTAVALDLQAGAPTQAAGVTVLPPAADAVLPLVLAAAVLRVQTTGPAPPDGWALAAELQDEEGGPAREVRFGPPLPPTAWVHIHRLRAAVGAARRSGLAQGPAIQADWAALLRRVQAAHNDPPNIEVAAPQWHCISASSADDPDPDAIIRPGGASEALRDAIGTALWLFPEGPSAAALRLVPLLGGRAAQQRRRLGDRPLRSLLEAMPDWLRVVDAPDEPGGYRCLPAAVPVPEPGLPAAVATVEAAAAAAATLYPAVPKPSATCLPPSCGTVPVAAGSDTVPTPSVVPAGEAPTPIGNPGSDSASGCAPLAEDLLACSSGCSSIADILAEADAQRAQPPSIYDTRPRGVGVLKRRQARVFRHLRLTHVVHDETWDERRRRVLHHRHVAYDLLVEPGQTPQYNAVCPSYLPPPALRWRADGFRAYAKFRRYVRLEIAAYPDGVAARRFAALPGLMGHTTQGGYISVARNRMRLRFDSVWELLRSMPDLVRIEGFVEWPGEPERWTLFPGEAVCPTVDLHSLLPPPDVDTEWLEPELPIPRPSLIPIARCDFPVPAAATVQAARGEVCVKPEYAALREIMVQIARAFPHGCTVNRFFHTFQRSARLPRGELRGLLRRACGARALPDLARLMPELVTVVPDPYQPWLSNIFPASCDPALHASLLCYENGIDADPALLQRERVRLRVVRKARLRVREAPNQRRFTAAIQTAIRQRHPDGPGPLACLATPPAYEAAVYGARRPAFPVAECPAAASNVPESVICNAGPPPAPPPPCPARSAVAPQRCVPSPGSLPRTLPTHPGCPCPCHGRGLRVAPGAAALTHSCTVS